MISARERFKMLLAGNLCEIPAAIFDPLSARAADRLEYAAAVLPGSLASHALLAAPDNMVVTMSELVELSARICRVSSLPVIVDADHGFGGVANVRRTVEELDRAGVAAITIEDTLLPPPFGASGKNALISIDEGRAKMHAALCARGQGGLAIIGRTSARALDGLDETVARLRAYEAEGVDALFVVGLMSEGELQTVASAVKLPLILAAVGTLLDDPALIARHRVRLLIRKHLTLGRAVDVVVRTLAEQKGWDGPLPDLGSLLTA